MQTPSENELKRYAVQLYAPDIPASIAAPDGTAVLEVPTSLGADAAARRAKWTAIQQRWGDVDEVTVVSTREIPFEEWTRDDGPTDNRQE